MFPNRMDHSTKIDNNKIMVLNKSNLYVVDGLFHCLLWIGYVKNIKRVPLIGKAEKWRG